MPNQIRIVLVRTSHAGNIGAAARAMKTMQLENLWLVAPTAFPAPEAQAMASGAEDVLSRARIAATLSEALAGCSLALATTARRRQLAAPIQTPREAASQLLSEPDDRDVAVVFGPERTGLANAELDLCQGLIRIPANPSYSSLNLAAAVQIIAYELMLARSGVAAGTADPDSPPATVDELEGFYDHLQEAMIDTGFLDPGRPGHLMRRLRRLFARARPEQTEVNILRGFLSASQGGKSRRRR